MRFIWPIAHYTLLEAVRGRLLVIAAVVAAGAFGLAAFIAQIAITEHSAVAVTIIAAVLRVGAVFLLTTFVVTSVVREFGDKGVELLLAYPMPRGAYVMGKYFGYAAAGALLALIVSLPLFFLAPPRLVAAWTLSLAVELAMLAAVGLFCVLSLTHVVAATAAVAAFYVLARALDAIQIIAASVGPADGWGGRIMDWTLAALALVMPRLDRMTQAAWLVDAVPASVLASGLGYTALFAALVLAASLFDFHRHHF